MHVDRLLETRGSLVALGRRAADDVALKLLKHEGDEWWSGEIVRAFAGRGVVLVLEHTDGALLLERLMPGHPLVDLTLRGADEEATAILARVVSAMRPDVAPRACATVEEWGRGFDRYLASHARHVSRALVERARLTYAALAGSQRDVRLLHGDLQQSNVLFDHARGWIAIDPKGVVGELAYELGAFLRNPVERPGTFLDPDVIERRVAQLASTLNVDRDRVIGWAFAQAVLSSIWSWEDGERVAAGDPVLVLAERLEAMLPPDCAPGEHSP
ncbi:MAG: aminoglycoside phosphotransferase family protein [Gemmatimonadaceae bacterium]